MSEKDRKKEDRSSRAEVERQDATGMDLPPGSSAERLEPEQYRPARITGGDEPSSGGDEDPARKP